MVATLAEMEEAVSSYTARAAEKLRAEHLAATVLTMFLHTNPFQDTPQYYNALTRKLPVATDSTPELIRSAIEGIRTIYRTWFLYKKVGIMLTGLVPASQVQTDLFDQHDRARSKKLMTALDSINNRFGSGTLHYASNGITKAWRTQFRHRSPAYTTNWDDLPIVKA